MMRFPYNYGGEAVAAVPFTYAGSKFEKGKPVPYRELRIIDSDLANLWRASKIDFTGKPYPTAPTAGAPPAAPSVPVKAASPHAQAQRR